MPTGINKKIKLINSLIIILLLIFGGSKAYTADYPHFEGNNIGCDSCHFVSGTQPSLMPLWTVHTPTDIDDTQYNTLCWSCHNDVDAPYVKTHSSLQTDNGYGDWTIECKVCHNPHYQKQFDTYGSVSYLYSGASTGITATTLTKTGAGWTVNSYQGLVVVPNIAQKRYKYQIASNTSDTLTLEGPVNLTKAAAGNTFAIVYGKLINSTIATPNSGSKTVKLFNSTGTNSFTDGNATYDGVCEVCHTQTTYHKNTSAGDHSHNAGTACTSCHVHTKGFKVACDICHGYPPVLNTATGGPDGLANNPGATGSAIAGAHSLHADTKGYACTVCHYNSAGSGATHNNSLTITMGYSLFNGTYQGGSYDGQAGVNYNAATTTPATTVSNTGTKTCSNIYCHSTGQSTTDGNSSTPAYASPVWDNPSSAACGTCHKVSEAAGLTSGSHAAHLGTPGVSGCGDCHTGAANDASSYNSSNHVNASINVANTYTAGGAPGNGYGTCSAASCHDDGTGSPAVTPEWGTSVTDCTECHAEIPVTGSHQKHVVTTNYNKAVCGDCHDSAVQGTTGPAQHLDGDLDVYDTAAGDLGYPQNVTKGGAPYDTCSTAYCHSTGQSTTNGSSATPTYSTVTWGGSAACGTCHKVTEASGLTSGSHASHLGSTGVDGCGDCHTGAANDASSYNSVSHINRFIDVDNTYSADGTPGNGYGTCGTASCHDDGTGSMVTSPAWGSSPASCTECHAAAPATGSHSPHLAVSGIACNNCHESAVQGTTAPAQHLDGNIDVYDTTSGDLGYPQNKVKGSAYSTCTAASCHDNGTGTLVATPTWGTAVNDCSECHATQPATGSHTNHLTAATGHGYKRPSCGNCHGNAVEGTTAPVQHLDGNLDVYDVSAGDLGYPQNTAKGGSPYNNCTTAYCHSSGQSYTDPNDPTPTYATQTWGSGGLCGTCHKAETTHNFFGQTIDSGSHTKHLSYGFKLGSSTSLKCTICHKWEASEAFGACNQCHGRAGANTYHADGTINVFFDTEYAPRDSYGDQTGTPGNGYFSCSNVYCHSTGQSTTDGSSATPTYSTPTWGNTASAACGTCHKVTEASGLTSGSHAAHLGTTGVNGCGDCHTGAANDASSYNDLTKHVNKAIDVANAYTKGGTPGNGYGTCSTASCHDNGTGTPAVTPVWGTNAANCTQCHAAAPATGSHTAHLAQSGVACNDCHNGAVQSTTAPAQHLDGNIDVYYSGSGDLGYPQNKTKGSAYSTCSTVSCHSNGLGVYKITPTWGGPGTGCNMCHNALPTTGSHSAHIKTAGTAYGSTAVNNTAADVDLDCGNCHPVNSANHRNGSLEITLNKNHGGPLKSKNGATDDTSGYTRTAGTSVTCSAAYCHSQGNGDFDKTSPNWYGGSITACNVCHGNATYSDYRKATPLYTSGSPKGNAHIFHNSAQTTPSNEMQCVNCHGITTTTNTSIADWTKHVNGVYDVDGGGTYWDFGSIGETWYGTDTTVTIGSYDQGTKKCMNVSCHPASDTAQKTWAADNYLCTDCHIIDMTSPSSYHHAMNNAGTGYPTVTPQGDALTGTNPENRTCLMCHVDHNIFSPLLNTNSTSRANVLRVGIDTVPVAGDATTFTNTDFNAATGAGICISCHQQELIKDTSRRMTETNVTRTPVITVSDYTSASHQYVVNSRYTNDGGTFNANCTKCHDTQEDEPNTFQGMYSGDPSNTNRFGVHVGPIRRLQANLGISAPQETEEEDLCYRCHSKSTDSNPGGGAAKAVANRDFYNATNMSAASQDIFTVMQSTGGRPAGPTSTTDKLYFKPSAAETPSEAMPNAHSSGDTFQGGTWTGRSMSPWTTATNYESYNQTLSVPTGTVNWRAITFTSPAVSTDTTIPAGNWVVSIYARESSTAANATVRYTIYKWNSNDTQGATIIARNTHVMEFSTLAAPGSLHTMTMPLGSPVTLAAGEKLVVDVEIQTVSVTTSGSRTLSLYFGNGATGSLQMPGNVTFTYADPGNSGYGHNVSLYSGKHKPSNSDETLAYIGANKHVECTDCHNMHAAGPTKHTQGTNAVSAILRGVPGAIMQAGTGTTSTLYFRNTTPVEPVPNATASTDTFQGGTWQSRDMLAAQGSAAQSQAVTINNTGNPRYWRMTSFISPPVTSATNIAAGNWTLRIWAQESNTGANAYMRVTIYEWNANDTKGTVIVAPTSYGSELTTTSTAYSWTVSGGAASLSTGDRVVIELEIDSRAATATTYTATYRWNGSGTTNDSYVTMPTALPLSAAGVNWTAPTYLLGTATKAYEICFKCHSGANTNYASWGGSGAASWMDVGLAFNPANKSFHPIVAAANSSGSGSSVLNAAQLSGGWSPGQTMYCTDCHSTDSATSSGPHGSAIKWMLAGTNKAWPYTTAAYNGTSSGGTLRTYSNRATNQGTVNGLFCLNCHPINVNNTHTKSNHSSAPCVGCHIRIPHGGKVSRLISATDSATPLTVLPARLAPDGNGGGTVYLRKFTKTTYTGYSKSNCYSSNGSCSDHNSSGNGTESW